MVRALQIPQRALLSSSSRVHHPNVVLFIGACLENLSFVVEYCERGSFFDVLQRKYHQDRRFRRRPVPVGEDDELTPARVLSILRGAARGMSYLHAQTPPMIHRDLKSLNILVCHVATVKFVPLTWLQVTEGWQGKVADFGHSRRSDDTSAAVMTKQHIVRMLRACLETL